MQRGYNSELCREDGCVHGAADPDETQGGVDREAHMCLLTVWLHTSKQGRCFIAFGALALFGRNNSGNRRRAVRHGVCGWTWKKRHRP